MPVITDIADLRRLHERRSPRMFFDYCESGSWTEQTFRENTSDFEKLRFRQRVAVDLSNRSVAGRMLGEEVAMPVALSPVGMTGMQRADGEIKAARAAKAFGVPYTLSTMSICSIEDVAEHAGPGFWFQLYVMKDEAFVDAIIERAKRAGCSALVLTLDLQALGQRHKDLKNALTAPPRLTPRNLLNIATKPVWAAEMLRTRRHSFGNVLGHASGVTNLANLMSWTAEQFDLTLDWEKVRRIREKWGGKLILKGILDAEDAKLAAEVGCDAIIVSNHGGRQLDGALSSIRVLPSILRALEGRARRPEVWLDSGIRSGQDILKALAMGADATMIGRAYIYGLGAMGEAGVTKALEVMRKELDLSMAFCGHRRLEEVTRDILLVPEDFEGRWDRPVPQMAGARKAPVRVG
ncbi:alpha-hydroxy acid oxidase [Pseudoroseicyclus tamaricis]|uniref:Alpha-hydroxy-acid oxidizing protein n=1 Tax=Pseudoroseicyclus tamaricis TaxID=2705421 RepID=A0A6B2JJ31_9RHOB|nr:alpha-hydroxy acid oxidase [Pseudoroseicyclus tamaricis]NDV01421.1 alpha-hydroxy-acid oxidizing protein [Pseudoroseicyclus tamaricis]